MNQQKKSGNRKMGVTISLMYGIPAVILLSLLTFLVLVFVNQNFMQEEIAISLKINYARSGELNQWMSPLKRELQVFAKQASNYADDPEGARDFITEKALIKDEFFEAVYFVDENGDAQALEQEINLADDAGFKALMNGTSDYYLSNAFYSELTNAGIVRLAVPVKDSNGTVFGCVFGNLSVNALCKAAEDITNDGAEGGVFITDGVGMMIGNTKTELVMNLNVHDSAANGLAGFEAISNKMKIGEAGYSIANDVGEGQLLMAAVPVPSTPNWYIGYISMITAVNKAFYSVTTILVILSSIILIIFIGVSILVSRNVVKNIRLAEKSIKEIAEGDADLTRKIVFNRNDELGSLMKNFNHFVDKLHNIVSNIKSSQGELVTINKNLSESVQDTASSILEILANIDNVGGQIGYQVSSVNNTSTAVTEIAHNIESLEQMIANQAAGLTEASASIEQMVGNIATVSSSIEKMASAFRELSVSTADGLAKQAAVNTSVHKIADQSEALMEANKTIANIASQTNLLAMNAAIEAAHAGDSGKGFSVVADEIRRLSETSTEQSRTIKDELKNIRDSIDSVVKASLESEETFNQIAGRVGSVNTLVEEIARAMTEQQEGSKQIFQALGSMNEITSQVRIGSSEMAQGNKSILDSIKTLKDTSFSIKSSMDEISQGAKGINDSVANLTTLSKETTTTIERVESVIGQFKV